MATAKDVTKQLRATLRPLLCDLGFRETGTRFFWRERRHQLETVQLPSFNAYTAAVIGCTTQSFSVHIGIRLPSVPSLDDREALDMWRLPAGRCDLHCTLRRRHTQPELYRDDIWYVHDDGQNIVHAVADAREAILQSGLPWLAQYADPQAVLARLLDSASALNPDESVLGAPGSLVRHRAIAYFAWSLGDLSLALRHLEAQADRARELDAKDAGLTLRTPVSRSVTPRLITDLERLRSAVCAGSDGTRAADAPVT